MAGDAFLTLAGCGQARIAVRRSQFFSYGAPVGDEAAWAAFLRDVRGRHPGARHVPGAWVDAAGTERAFDDGEPPGTGGRPCLAALRRRGLAGSGVAVARLFGGTLLGAGNLGRAYGEAAEAAVRAAGVVRRVAEVWIWVEVAFAEVGHTERALSLAGARIEARQYGEAARFGAWVPCSARAGLERAVHGRVSEGDPAGGDAP